MTKLDHHDRLIAQKLFCHPINHNLRWIEVCSLLARFGEVHETHRGNWAVTVHGETYSFGSARTRVLTNDQVVRVRRFLTLMGVSKTMFAA